MKTKNLFIYFTLGLFACILDSCSITDIPVENPEGQNPISSAIDTSTANNNQDLAKGKFTEACDLIKYPDTLVFLDPNIKDLVIKPLQAFEGEYGAIPEGLEIDKNDGEIRINKSESGLKYKVYFVPKKSNDTCFTYLTVSGIDYLSDIYILNEGDSLAIPFYNGNLAGFVPGSNTDDDDDDEDDEDNEFDDGADDDDNDGDDDEPLPNQEILAQGVDINKLNGKIRLDNTLKNGIFGNIPVNGANRDFRLNYRLNDNSKKALNKIDLRFHYFETLADVPQDLQKRIAEIKEFYNENSRKSGRTMEAYRLFAKPRPPDIIIVARRRR